MKIVGIIGGFGPAATARFYLELVAACRTTFGSQPQLIVRNVTVPNFLEEDALLEGKKLTKFIPLLTTAAKNLEAAGADFIVLPCNTLHVHTRQIRHAVSVPFVSIVESSLSHLQHRKVKNVGLLGTQVTVKKNLFAQLDPSITFITVPPQIQKNIDTSLHVFVTTGKDDPLKNALYQAIAHLQDLGVKDSLIACTDFHGLISQRKGMTIHDTLDILVKATLDRLKGAE